MSQDEGQHATRTAVLFVVLAIGFSWLYLGAVLLARAGVLPFSMENEDFYVASIPGTIIWAVFRTFGPAIAGFIAVGICLGRAGVIELGRSVIRWRVRPGLYLSGWFGLIPSGAFLVTGYLLGRMRFSPGGITVQRFIVFFVLMALLDGPLGEEIGWRGVLLPQLLLRRNVLSAASIVGVVWYVWHIPLYIADGKLPGIGEHAAFLYSCILLSIIMTWFFVKSGGSTLLAIYVHNCTNYSIFLRMKLFAISGSALLPRVAGLVVLTIIAAAAARALRARSDNAGEAGPTDSNASREGALRTSQTTVRLRRAMLAALMTFAGMEAFGATPLPVPDGPYKVGTRVVYLTDPSRRDPAVATRAREIVVQVWYPAAASTGLAEPYVTSAGVGRYLRENGYYEVSPAEIDWWCALPTHSTRNAPLPSRKRFPLLTFSIGSGVGRFSYTSILEEMASHGYIVAAIDHPYGGVTTLANGQVISTAGVTSRGDDEASAAELTEEWARDIRLVIRRALALPFLSGHIDRRKIGAFGHSLGGAAALEAARIDPTIRAVVDMDGGTFGDVGRLGVPKPALILRSHPQYSEEDLAKRGQTREQRERMAATFDAMFSDFFNKHRDVAGYVVKVRRTGHFSFSDAPFVMPQTITRFGGDILDAETTWRRVTACLLSFFDLELRGKRSSLLVEHEDGAFLVQVFGPAAEPGIHSARPR